MKLRQEQPGDDIISVSEIGSMNIAISVLTLCRHIDAIHYIQTWIIDCCADEIRNSFEPLVQLCSLSVTQWVSHSIIHSVGSLVSQSVRPSVSQSVDQACLHSLSRRGCLLCVGLSFILSATSFPVFLVCSNDAPWNAMMYTLQWVFSLHGLL